MIFLLEKISITNIINNLSSQKFAVGYFSLGNMKMSYCDKISIRLNLFVQFSVEPIVIRILKGSKCCLKIRIFKCTVVHCAITMRIYANNCDKYIFLYIFFFYTNFNIIYFSNTIQKKKRFLKCTCYFVNIRITYRRMHQNASKSHQNCIIIFYSIIHYQDV